MSIHIHPLYLVSVVVLWIVVYHVAYWAVAIARDAALVCWSVGLFGVSVVSLRQPPVRRVLAQLVAASVTLACTAYASLYLVTPPPIAGLSQSTSARAVAVLIPAGILSLVHVAGVIRDRRSPIWGEARVLTSVQRGLATGARIYFTPTGRAFLRERFDATPAEFMRMVRY